MNDMEDTILLPSQDTTYQEGCVDLLVCTPLTREWAAQSSYFECKHCVVEFFHFLLLTSTVVFGGVVVPQQLSNTTKHNTMNW